MNVAVTGHTSGLGKAFFNYYEQNGHTVHGFSRQTGYDLRDWAQLQNLLDATENFDLIISNAKPDFVQAVLLYEWVKRITRAKQIISIGSCIVNLDIDKKQEVGINLYKTQKLALQNAHQQLIDKYTDLNSILVHPYHLYSYEGIDYDVLRQWIIRMEFSMNSTTVKELYVQ